MCTPCSNFRVFLWHMPKSQLDWHHAAEVDDKGAQGPLYCGLSGVFSDGWLPADAIIVGDTPPSLPW